MNATLTWHDTVVEEIHATRERFAEQYHDDLLAYSNAAVARCRALGLNMAEDRHHIAQAAMLDIATGKGAPVAGR